MVLHSLHFNRTNNEKKEKLTKVNFICELCSKLNGIRDIALKKANKREQTVTSGISTKIGHTGVQNEALEALLVTQSF